MKLYIGNGSRQELAFMYSVPAMNGRANRTQFVRPGGQVQLTGELDKGVVDDIIQQHHKYGMRDVSELDGLKTFVGYIFSIDKVIPMQRLMKLIESNQKAKIEEGRKIRETAAVSESVRLEDQLEENEMPGLRSYKMEIVEETSDQRGDTEAIPPIAEGIDVTRFKLGDPPPRQERGRRRKAA